MTNSEEPDQLASSEDNWSGSALFAKAGHIRVQQELHGLRLLFSVQWRISHLTAAPPAGPPLFLIINAPETIAILIYSVINLVRGNILVTKEGESKRGLM